MARPAWTNIPDTDTDVDSPLDTDLFTGLKDNADAARIGVFGYDFTEATTTNTTWTPAATGFAKVYVPSLADYSGISRNFTCAFECKVSGGTGQYRLKDSATGSTSSAVSVTATSYTPTDVTLTIPDAWKGTLRTLDLEFQKVSTGTVYVQAPFTNGGRVEF